MEKEVWWTKLLHNRHPYLLWTNSTAQLPSTSSISSPLLASVRGLLQSCCPSPPPPTPPRSRCTGQLWLWALALTHQLAQGKQHTHKTQGCSYLLRLWQLVRDMDEQMNEHTNEGMNQRWERLGWRKGMASQAKRQEKRYSKTSAANKSLRLPWEMWHHTPVPGVACLLIA